MTGFFGNTGTDDSRGLDMAAVLSAIQAMRESVTIWYATSEYINPGNVLMAAKTEYSPEYLVVHPDDLEMLQAQYLATWRHVREWRPEVRPENAGIRWTHDETKHFSDGLQKLLDEEQ